MKIKDKRIIEAYLKLKIRATYVDLQLLQLKNLFYKACARNAIRVDGDSNRVVDLSGTQFHGKVHVREAWTRKVWKYGGYLTRLENRLAILKKTYELRHKPQKNSKRIWATDVYKHNMRSQLLFISKVIHKGRVYDKKNFSRRKTTAVA